MLKTKLKLIAWLSLSNRTLDDWNRSLEKFLIEFCEHFTAKKQISIDYLSKKRASAQTKKMHSYFRSSDADAQWNTIDYNQSLQLTLLQIKSDSQKMMSDVESTGDLHRLRLDELQVAWTERASSWLDTCTIRLHCLDELRLSNFRLFEQSVCYRLTSNNSLSQICIKSQVHTFSVFHYSQVDDLLNKHTAMSQKCD